MEKLSILKAEKKDVNLVLDFIHRLAEYEKLSHEVVATPELLLKYLFGKDRVAEAAIAYMDGTPVGFALWFYNFSTFLGRPGIYLEDLFVLDEYRGRGVGKGLLAFLAKLAVENNYGRLEWAVLDWNEPSIRFYQSLGAKTLDEWLINRLTGASLKALARER